ncbi:MAG: hypothetical protein P0116_16330 [Candidatus Nitrosocosmicus sp.]|nr:hypothetical protein [Candidatus Nitrosocosmicus sp.]
MDYDVSPKMLAIVFVIAGVVIVFVLMGGSLRQLFSSSIEENAMVQISKDGKCIVEGSDKIPRTIENCQYKTGDNITIRYKQGMPALESHSK